MASVVTTRDTSWVTPRTWVTGEALLAVNMNTYLSDLLTALKEAAYFECVIDEGADYSVTGTSWADVDGTDLSATIVTGGGIVEVSFSGIVAFTSGNAAAHSVLFDVMVDGANYAGDDGITGIGHSTTITGLAFAVSFTIPITGLSAGSHTFKLRWRTTHASAVTGTLYAGAGTSGRDVHPRFIGRELF